MCFHEERYQKTRVPIQLLKNTGDKQFIPTINRLNFSTTPSNLPKSKVNLILVDQGEKIADSSEEIEELFSEEDMTEMAEVGNNEQPDDDSSSYEHQWQTFLLNLFSKLIT